MTNKVCSRRSFLASLLGAGGTAMFLASRGWAYPIGTLLGPGNPGYVQEYLRRMREWYAKTYFDFAEAMDATERRFVVAALKSLRHWDYSLGVGQAFDHFLLSHRYDSSGMNHSRMAIGNELLGEEPKRLAMDVLRKRGAHLPNHADGLYGLGWDFKNDLVKTYHLHANASALRDPELRSLVNEREEAELFPARISSYSFKSGRLVSSKLIVAYREPPIKAVQAVPFGRAEVGVMQLRSKSFSPKWHFRLNAFNLEFLSPEGQQVGLAHEREFGQMTNSLIWKDERDYTLYYP